MPKKLTENNKKEMVELFKKGENVKNLAILFSLKENTIIKHLKNLVDDFDLLKKKYLINYSKEKEPNKIKNLQIKENSKSKNNLTSLEFSQDVKPTNEISDKTNYEYDYFQEISPLDEFTDFELRKDLTSELLKETSLPKNIFMIVNNNIELEIKQLNDFPEYSFLPNDDQDRRVIKLFSDKKSASSFCDKSQRIIKIPDGRIFKLVSPILLQKGITRILFEDTLLSV